jgi:hypothetical protein
MEERKARKTLNHTIDLGDDTKGQHISKSKEKKTTYRPRMIEHKPTIDKKGPKQSTVARFNIGNRKSSKLIFSINKLGEVAFLYTYEFAQLTLSHL